MKKTIPQDLISYIKTERVCSIATIKDDGKPHCAAMLYSFSLDPLKLVFMTENDSKKVSSLVKKKSVDASITIGLTEAGKRTVQMSGLLSIPKNENDGQKTKELYYERHPLSRSFETDKAIFMVFSPYWLRDTKYLQNGPEIEEYTIE